jgi:hypothetical protein
MRVLSIVASAASLERSWSKLGNTHTKLRNRMALEKARKTSILVDDLKRQHADAGLLPRRRKRKFGSDNPKEMSEHVSLTAVQAPDSEQPDGYDSSEEEPESFTTLAQRCIADASADINAEAEMSPQAPVTFGGHQRIPLKLLFKYPEDHSKASEIYFFKSGGIRNLQKEMEFYESFVVTPPDDMDTLP